MMSVVALSHIGVRGAAPKWRAGPTEVFSVCRAAAFDRTGGPVPSARLSRGRTTGDAFLSERESHHFSVRIWEIPDGRAGLGPRRGSAVRPAARVAYGAPRSLTPLG